MRAHPEGTFFHLAEWQDVLQRAFGHETHYLLAETGDGVISGVLPLSIVLYLMGTPMRRRARRARELESPQDGDGSGHAAGGAGSAVATMV